MKLVVFSAGTVLLQLAVALALGEADHGTSQLADYARARRGWSMMRLGRGLQMLRLGKRMAAPLPSHHSQATPDNMRKLLDELLEVSQDELYPHQLLLLLPPQDMDEDALEELNDLLEEDSRSDLHPYSADLTSRFKRSAHADFKSRREPTSVYDQSYRPIFPAASRIGQYLGDVSRLKEWDWVLKGGQGGDGDVKVIDATTESKDVGSQMSLEEREKQKEALVTDPEAL